MSSRNPLDFKSIGLSIQGAGGYKPGLKEAGILFVQESTTTSISQSNTCNIMQLGQKNNDKRKSML